AAAMVSGTAIRMIGRDPSISPATVKARLMSSARTVPGDPVEVGAGLLDVRAALDA
ncbi:MAG: type VII secretion-associated serine protease mycosin, partial [Acidobacteria bacterium]|nr:type VII secretion-associated serine protease mycosin [Acidobacteriota bacterium]NIQ86908.1 type VII secretion-associated serine protease mycosin [Acidobacteriota bacterium]